MSLGRYDPPRALVDDIRTMGDRPTRPLAVTAFQALLVLICGMSLEESVRLGFWMVTNGDQRYLGDSSLRMAWAAVCMAVTAGAVVAIHNARSGARYLGWLVFAVLIGFAQIDAANRHASTPAVRGGFEVADRVWEILLVIWAFRFGLSAKAKRYFGKQTAISH